MSNSLIDCRIQIKPRFGPNAKKPITVETFNKFDVDPGAAYDILSGRRQAPVGITTKAAKPKIDLELSDWQEGRTIWRWIVGPGAAPRRGSEVVDVSAVWTRLGETTIEVQLLQMAWPVTGFSAADSGVTAKVSTVCRNILIGYGGEPPVTIYQS